MSALNLVGGDAPATEWLGSALTLWDIHPDCPDDALISLQWIGDVQVIGVGPGSLTADVLSLVTDYVGQAAGVRNDGPALRPSIVRDAPQGAGWNAPKAI